MEKNNLKLPDDFLSNMENLLKDRYNEYILAMNEKPVRGIRINPIKINVDDFEKINTFKLSNIPHEKYGRVLESDEKVGITNLHNAGIIYSQEPSSMLAVSSVEWRGDEYVLDLCAAPGGKSTQVAAHNNNGIVVSNEIVTNRAKILFSNIERLGVTNSIILNDTPQNISNNIQGFFDVVLVDAPCSGEGMFRKDPDTIEEWSNEGIIFNANRQLEILCCADKCLKQGGKLIYSTCTFSETEDEDVVLRFLEDHDYKLIETRNECKVWTTTGTKIQQARRFFPFTGKGEGQFVCVLEKNGEENQFSISKRLQPNYLKGKDKDIAEKFINDNFSIPCEYKLVLVRNEIMLITQDMEQLLPLKVNVVNAGVRVGSIEKGVIRPHHQVFSALGKYAKNKIELGEDDYKKYIHGEELKISQSFSGYAVVTVFGASLGGGKCVNGTLKNLYPKGLRI